MAAARVTGLTLLLSLTAFAHADPHDAGPEITDSSDLVAPVLLTRAEPTYPLEALREGREAHVHLELLIDEAGAVSEARVLESGGEAFDDAMLAAVKHFTFSPATQQGRPVRALITYTQYFKLSHTDAGPSDAGTVGPSEYATVILARRPISAASSFSVRDRDFALRPIGSVQDILRVTPGLVMVQHSGGGKANQYFIRGFDADHGTDLALSIDGVPINMVSHAHGQGFADTNFIIPEVVERVEVTKGPYFANQGDLATAGSVNLVSREHFEHSSFSLGGLAFASPNFRPGVRALGIASPTFENLHTTFAAEVSHSDGPFDNAENWNRYKLFNRLTIDPTANSTVSLIHMSYGSDWHGSGQIPDRAVEQGLISRFGSLDPSEGGATSRHQMALQYSLRPDDHSEFKAMAYLASYRFNLFSNFTLFLNNETDGDEIEQNERRVFMGAKVSYRTVRTWGRVRFDTTVGAEVRNDDVHAELWNTKDRVHLVNTRNNDVHQTLGGLFINEEVSPWSWVRLNVGARADLISFAVDDRLAAPVAQAPVTGIGGHSQLSPKLSLIVSPLENDTVQLDVYGNYGHGFHSNDVRGFFSTPSVTPLTRAVGAEVGSRARLLKRWDLAAALWRLELANETVWVGDEGTTEVNDASTRYGIELETRFDITSWLAADLDVSFTRSRFSSDHSNGGGLALAPQQTWSGGLSARHALGPGIARAGLRFFGIGDRPANDDGSLIAPGFTQFDLHLGYRHRWFDLALDLENLLNGQYRSAQFATVSRLQNEPSIGAPLPSGFSCGSRGRLADPVNGGFGGCENVNYTPAYPLSARLTATVFFD